MCHDKVKIHALISWKKSPKEIIYIPVRRHEGQWKLPNHSQRQQQQQ